MGVSFGPMEKVIGNQRKTGHGRWGEKDEGCARRNERERGGRKLGGRADSKRGKN